MLGSLHGSPSRQTFASEVSSPDILAVVDVPQPEEDSRRAWVVADEGRGPDLVMAVLHDGNRKRDLVENVERYAHLGIREYFIYDRLRQQIHGYRLPEQGATRYQRIRPQVGRCHSTVLGLDLVVASGRLQFLYGMSELIGSDGLIRRLKSRVEDLETMADQSQAQAEQAVGTSLRQTLLAIVEARFRPFVEEAGARAEACDDPSTLQRWLLRAATAATLEEIFSA